MNKHGYKNVQVDYSEKINADVPTQLSLKLDNKTYLKIDVQADLSSKKTAVFNFYTAKNGVVTKFDMGIPAQMSGISIKNKEGVYRGDDETATGFCSVIVCG